MSVGSNLEKLFSLEGKVALLTGAAGGIGAELAKGIAGAGASLAACDISEKGLDALLPELDGPGTHRKYLMDVSKLESINANAEHVLKDYRQIDILVNCAGVNKREGLLDVEESTYDRLMDINLKSVFFLTQKVVRDSMRKTGGKIVNVGSYNCTSMLGGCSVYGATKSGIQALTRSMAIEWAKFNIQANCIAPGHILTPLTTVTWENKQRADYLRTRIAAERPGTPDELVGTVVLLCSPASSYMTGQMVNLDGGALAGGSPWQYDTQY